MSTAAAVILWVGATFYAIFGGADFGGGFWDLIAGWVTTEVGRQPWVVFKVMLTSQAVTGARGIVVGYATLAAVYLGVACGVFWVLRRLARAPLRERERSPLGPTTPAT